MFGARNRTPKTSHLQDDDASENGSFGNQRLEGKSNFSSLQKDKGEKKMERLWKFIKDEDGLETPEYAVMGALIVVGLVATVILLRGSIITTFTDMTDAIGSR